MTGAPGQSLPPFSGARPVALVTGGARRVGRAICLALASRGCDVALTWATSEREAEGTAGEIRRLGVEAWTVRLDLADLGTGLGAGLGAGLGPGLGPGPGAVARVGAELGRVLGRLDVLVHNASTYEPSPLAGLDVGRAERQMRVNALGPLALSAALAPLLGRSVLPGGGAIVAMLDIHAEGLPRRDHVAYAMSKGALSAMVRGLARDLAPRVRVNGVAPGVVAWPERGVDAQPEVQSRYLAQVPLGRSGTVEEAAGAVAFLALDATYTTGEVLRVDGGRGMR